MHQRAHCSPALRCCCLGRLLKFVVLADPEVRHQQPACGSCILVCIGTQRQSVQPDGIAAAVGTAGHIAATAVTCRSSTAGDTRSGDQGGACRVAIAHWHVRRQQWFSALQGVDRCDACAHAHVLTHCRGECIASSVLSVMRGRHMHCLHQLPRLGMTLFWAVQVPSAREAVALSPGGPWMISSEDWDDATEAACWEKIDL